MDIYLVKVESVLFIGEKEARSNILMNPRMVFADSESGKLDFIACIGSPKMLTITAPHFAYESLDEEINNFYRNLVNPKEVSPIITPNKAVSIVK